MGQRFWRISIPYSKLVGKWSNATRQLYWLGRAYPDFQGMQILTGTVSLLSTIEYHYVLMWIIPLLSSLAIPMLFIIGKEIAGFIPALFGSAFYGVTFGVVYANSHPMPGGLAETLGFVLILNWIKIQEMKKYGLLIL